jgi:hypothetical protein
MTFLHRAKNEPKTDTTVLRGEKARFQLFGDTMNTGKASYSNFLGTSVFIFLDLTGLSFNFKHHAWKAMD